LTVSKTMIYTMKLQTFAALLLWVALFSLLAACNDPTFIGSDLVEEDAIDVEFTENILIEAKTVRLDSVRTYSPGSSVQLSSFLCGEIVDPFFGKTSAQIFAQLGIQFSRPDFLRANLDSIVLILPYDSAAFYNFADEDYGFEVARVVEPMDAEQTYFSDRAFATDLMPLGQIDTKLTPASADTFVVYSSSGTPNVVPFRHLSIPLSTEFGTELLTLEEDTYENDSTFIDHLAGINIRSTTENRGMPAFDLRSSNAGMYLFYTREDTTRQFFYPFKTSNVRMVNLEHDYTNAPVEPFINNAELGDSLLFAQAASGLNVEVAFPDLSKFEGVVVNKAVLEFTVADLSTDGAEDLEPVEQFIAVHENASGNLVLVPEIANSEIINADFRRTFGGTVTPTKDGEGWLYQINISTHFQDIIDGIVSNKITIQPFPNPERASRVGMYGPGASGDKKLRMQLTFTQL